MRLRLADLVEAFRFIEVGVSVDLLLLLLNPLLHFLLMLLLSGLKRLGHLLPPGAPSRLVFGGFGELLHLLSHPGVVLGQILELQRHALDVELQTVHDTEAGFHHINLFHCLAQHLNLQNCKPQRLLDG